MSDDLFESYITRAAETLISGHAAHSQLRTCAANERKPIVDRWAMEIAMWDAMLKSHESYSSAMALFTAAETVWQLSGRVGTKPEPPQWPEGLPQRYRCEAILMTIGLFRFNINQFGYVFKHGLLEEAFEKDLVDFARRLSDLAQAINEAREEREKQRALESEENEPFAETVEFPKVTAKQREAPLAISEPMGDDLTPRERIVLEAIGDKSMQAPELADKSGYTNNSSFRTMLSNLVKRRHLRKNSDGSGYSRKLGQ